MSDTLDKLERTLDRQMELLADHLRTPDPHSECIERVKAAVAQDHMEVVFGRVGGHGVLLYRCGVADQVPGGR